MKQKIALLSLCLIAAFAVGQRAILGAAARADAAPSQPAAAETAAPDSSERAAALLSEMTKEEKAWQMLITYPEDVCGALSCDDALVWDASLTEKPVGGFVISGENMESPEALKAMLSAISAGGSIPAFLCVDEEGGAVARLRYTLGVTTEFKPMFTYRALGEQVAFENAETIAEDLRAFGFHVDFAPVADVWTNPENSVIGKRAYSDDPAEAAALVGAAVEGFTAGGVISVLKHFPGHGDTAGDSHAGAVYSERTAEQLRQCEFLPFIAGLEHGAGMVMVGHITMREIDPDRPATLSKTVVTDLLRGELGYDGVVVTDAMRMGALDAYSASDAAVAAVEAGCDLILAPWSPEAVVAAMLERVDEQRLDESVLRILKLKLDSGILQ